MNAFVPISAFGLSRTDLFIFVATKIPKENEPLEISEENLSMADNNDLSKILGYIPLIGTIVGIARLVFSGFLTFLAVLTLFDDKETDSERKGLVSLAGAHLVRSMIEMSGISLLVLPIVDLLVGSSEMNHRFEGWIKQKVVVITKGS